MGIYEIVHYVQSMGSGSSTLTEEHSEVVSYSLYILIRNERHKSCSIVPNKTVKIAAMYFAFFTVLLQCYC